MVLDEDGDVVTRPEAARPEQPRQPVRALVELAIGDDVAGRAHDQRGAVRRVLCDCAGIHARSLPRIACAAHNLKGEP